jgi:hypothetical protein
LAVSNHAPEVPPCPAVSALPFEQRWPVAVDAFTISISCRSSPVGRPVAVNAFTVSSSGSIHPVQAAGQWSKWDKFGSFCCMLSFSYLLLLFTH